eukprot:s1_g899.t1
MCGIVGLFAKTERYEASMGALLAPMLVSMSDRGPDSAGFAVFGDSIDGFKKITVRSREGALSELGVAGIKSVEADDHTVLQVPEESVERVLTRLAKLDIRVVATGKYMSLFKGVGLPEHVTTAYGLEGMTGTHALGHTRMATESAVTTDGAHPFTTGPDLCLVHNGSLSNHASMKRKLLREGIEITSDNDSEVASAYLTWRLGQGLGLADALEGSLSDLDGFFTFVVGTADGFGVLRDPIACKPAVMAETEDLIAFGSEYRALAGLPGIESAKVWEPEPGKVYFWEHAA